MNNSINLRPVDRLEIITLVDNTSDVLLASDDRVQRPPFKPDSLVDEPLMAEHGYAALVRVSTGNTTRALLFDAGLSKQALTHNADRLGIALDQLDTVVLSHGHTDHTKGLGNALARMPLRPIRLHLHPDALLNRRLCLPNGTEVMLPPLDREAIENLGVELVAERGPSSVLEKMVLLTGEIPRRTEFERGFPPHQSQIHGEWQADAVVHDDQALVVRVRDKGLVVLTGCGHAGIVNTVNYARELTGEESIHAILGGFHLSGGAFEQIIDPTVEALEAFEPDTIVPGHCTGWKAIHQISARMPQAFIPNSVGSTFMFGRS